MHRVAIYAREDPTAGAQARLDAQVAAVATFVARHRGWHVDAPMSSKFKEFLFPVVSA